MIIYSNLLHNICSISSTQSPNTPKGITVPSYVNELS